MAQIPKELAILHKNVLDCFYDVNSQLRILKYAMQADDRKQPMAEDALMRSMERYILAKHRLQLAIKYNKVAADLLCPKALGSL